MLSADAGLSSLPVGCPARAGLPAGHMNLLPLGAVAALVVFLLGVLCGASWADRLHEARSRRQAAVQRQLNERLRELHDRQN